MKYSELVVRVSAHFLTRPLPDNWMELEDKELFDFMHAYAWEPLENWAADDVLFAIEALAQDLGRAFEVEGA